MIGNHSLDSDPSGQGIEARFVGEAELRIGLKRARSSPGASCWLASGTTTWRFSTCDPMHHKAASEGWRAQPGLHRRAPSHQSRANAWCRSGWASPTPLSREA